MSHAREDITILWGFSLASNQANTVRIMVEELNQSQTKYNFIIAAKPGAGGSIAANAVLSSPENTIVSMSSSFIIRPYYEKKDSTHNLDSFTPILVQGTGAPLYVLSKKYITFKEVVKQPNLTIGVSGIGSISHLAANEILKINPSATVVNFKNMLDASVAAAGGHVDVAISFYVDSKGLIDDNKLNVLAHTGNKLTSEKKNLSIGQYNLLESSKLTANYAIFASTKMSQDRFKELHKLLSGANQQPRVLNSYQKDEIIPAQMNIVESEVWYAVQRRFWRELVGQIKYQ